MCVNYPIYNESIGISKKIESQIETFKKLGYKVTYSAYLENGIAIFEDKSCIVKKQFNKSKIDYLLRRFRLLSICIAYLKTNEFDIGFIRWDAIDWHFLRVLSLMHNNCKKVLMDFHGYFTEYNGQGIKGKYTKYTTKINGNKLSKYVDYGMTETHNNSLFGVNTLPMDTGIDITKYKRHSYLGEYDAINMISVANETPYHGYDRIVYGIKEYIQKDVKTKVHVHLVGNISKSTKKLIEKFHLQDYFTLHGYKSGKELEDIYNLCNIGIGPLAQHRIGGKEGTGIKTKEYFAIGLPYFYAGQELLVPENYPYILKIESSNEPVDIKQVISFYNGIKNKTTIEKEMREFAENKFSWEKILGEALKKMEER